jgi:hypothetical protein
VTDQRAPARVVRLTDEQIRHLLDLLRFSAQLPWGRHRREAIRAKLTVALGKDDDA